MLLALLSVPLLEACPKLRVVYASATPDLINSTTPQPCNKYGIEDGRVVRAKNGWLYMVGAEMYADPKWVNMRLGVWRSIDGAKTWQRQRTLRQSSGNTTGVDPHAATWGPLLVHDAAADRWALLYVGYYAGGHNFSGWTTNWGGAIYYAEAAEVGDSGLDSDFGDAGDWRSSDRVLLSPHLGEPWPECQGLQGTDSMFPFALGDGTWAALVGTAHQEGSWHPSNPDEGKWFASVARAPSLRGPWKRMNPSGGDPAQEPCLNLVHHGSS